MKIALSPAETPDPYEINLPLKMARSALNNLSFSTGKAKKTDDKIAALKAAEFPIEHQPSLPELVNCIKKCKQLSSTSQDAHRPKFYQPEINGQKYHIDIYPFLDSSLPDEPKTRHDIVVSFPFPTGNESPNKQMHIEEGSSKQISLGWLMSKQPKRVIVARSPFFPPLSKLDSSTSMKMIRKRTRQREQTAHTEAVFMKCLANSAGFPEVYKSFKTADEHIFVMKHYRYDLFYYLKAQIETSRESFAKQLDDYAKIQIAIDLLTPIETMHEQGLMHRDIKMENYLLTSTEEIVLTDFGYTCKVDTAEASKCKGSPISMSWERLQKAVGAVSPKGLKRQENLSGDIWSLGQMLMYLCFDTIFPYACNKDINNLHQEDLPQIEAEMNTLSRCEPAHADKLLHLVWEMLHINPAQRPTAAEVSKRLLAIREEYSATDKTYTMANIDYNPWAYASSPNSTESHEIDTYKDSSPPPASLSGMAYTTADLDDYLASYNSAESHKTHISPRFSVDGKAYTMTSIDYYPEQQTSPSNSTKSQAPPTPKASSSLTSSLTASKKSRPWQKNSSCQVF